MKRQRGRGRKPGNNNNRNFESNGPDVKIRGNASHICDKYMQLARDAMSSGDRVMAENYYQHAEHYLRIVQANQAQQQKRDDNNDGDDNRGHNRRNHNQNDRDDNNASSDAGDNEDGDNRSRNRRGRSRRRDEQPENNSGDDPLQVVTPDPGAGEQPGLSSDDDEAPKPRRRGRPRKAEASEESGDEAPKPRRRTRRAPDPDAEAALKAADGEGGEKSSEDGAAA